MQRQPDHHGLAPHRAATTSTQSLPALLAIEITTLGLLGLFLWMDFSPEFAMSMAIMGVAGGVLVSLIRTNGITVAHRVGRRWAYMRRLRRGTASNPVLFDVPVPESTPIGFRWDSGRLISVVRISRAPRLSTLAPDAGVITRDGLSLGLVIGMLTQFDIALESIDVISHGWRVRGPTSLTQPYSDLIESLPVISHQEIFLILRLNPLACPDAVSARGGGSAGIPRTATTATRRVMSHMIQAGYVANTLNGKEISQLHAQLLDGVRLDDADEYWDTIDADGFCIDSYSLNDSLSGAELQRIWAVPAVSTVVAHCISTSSRDGLFSLRTMVRYNGISDNSMASTAHLTRLSGYQRPALDWTLPTPHPQYVGIAPLAGNHETFNSIHIPAGGYGQIIGAHANGGAAAIRLFGPDIRRVHLHGSTYFARQTVARALAIGARILIHSDRAEIWRQLVEYAGNPDVLWVSSWQATRRNADYTLCVLDSDTAAEEPAIASHLRIFRSQPEILSVPPGVDIVLSQNEDTPTIVTAMTRSQRDEVTLVATPSENQLFGSFVRQ